MPAGTAHSLPSAHRRPRVLLGSSLSPSHISDKERGRPSPQQWAQARRGPDTATRVSRSARVRRGPKPFPVPAHSPDERLRSPMPPHCRPHFRSLTRIGPFIFLHSHDELLSSGASSPPSATGWPWPSGDHGDSASSSPPSSPPSFSLIGTHTHALTQIPLRSSARLVEGSSSISMSSLS